MTNSTLAKWEAGQIPLVILPGFNGIESLLEPLLACLPKRVPVYIISYPLAGLGNFQAYRDFVVAKLSEFESYVLLAESFSGPIAFHALSLLQQPPRGIIFCATFLENPRPGLLSIASVIPLGALIKAVSKLRLAYPMLLGSNCSPAVCDAFYNSMSILPAATISERLRVMTQIPDMQSIDFSSLPACYLQASQDRLVLDRCVLPFQKFFPGLIVQRILASHFILQMAPAEAALGIRKFVGSLSCER